MSVRPKTTKIVWLAQGLPGLREQATNHAPPVQARWIGLWALIAVVLAVSGLWIATGQLRSRGRIIDPSAASRAGQRSRAAPRRRRSDRP